MRSILEEIYNGNSTLIFDHSVRSDVYIKALNDMCVTEELILKEFPECKELLNKYEDAQLRLLTESLYQRFLLGFKVGAQLMEEMKKPLE